MFKKINTKRLIIAVVSLLILFLPAIILLGSIKQYGVNVPHQDQWELVYAFEKIDSDKLGFIDIWRQHNEHRILIPRVIMLVSGSLTHWNIKYEMVISWIFAVLSFVVLLLILYSFEKLRVCRWLWYGIALLSSIMLFSYNQAENWVWGWQMQWFSANLFILLTVWLLGTNIIEKRSARMILAVLTATMATYCLGSGQYAWFAGALIVYATRQKLLYWCLALIVVLSSYYYKFSFLDGEGVGGLFNHPVLSAKYFLAYLGNPVTNYTKNAILTGFVGIFLLCIVFLLYWLQIKRYKEFRKNLALISIPLTLVGYAVFSALITTMSRSRLGVDQALASRYVSVAVFFWIGLFLLIALVYVYQAKKIQDISKVYLSSGLTAMLIIALVHSVNSFTFFKALSAERLISYRCSKVPKPSEDCIKKLYFPGTEALGDRLNYVKNKDIGGY
jgi:hypothetical protein